MAKKIMVVDDNEPLRSLVKELLNIYAPDCEIITAENGEKSIAVAKEMEPDVIFMDLKMPGMNGIEATAKIKSFLPSSRVVILTGFVDNKLLEDAKSAGACHYMLKNTMHNELKPLLKRLLAGEE